MCWVRFSDLHKDTFTHDRMDLFHIHQCSVIISAYFLGSNTHRDSSVLYLCANSWSSLAPLNLFNVKPGSQRNKTLSKPRKEDEITVQLQNDWWNGKHSDKPEPPSFFIQSGVACNSYEQILNTTVSFLLFYYKTCRFAHHSWSGGLRAILLLLK